MTTVTAKKPVIGLLGAPGSGKSLVAAQFGELGCAVIDADGIARAQLREPDVKQQLVAWWGQDVLDATGEVDRAAVGRIVFNAPEQKRRLEQLIHPRVHARRRQLHEQHQQNPAVRAIVEDSPLILESGMDRECDVLVYVQTPRSVREARVGEHRGWSAEELRRRESAQAPLDTKRSRADHVVQNDADRLHTFEQVRRVFSKILQTQPPAERARHDRHAGQG